MTKTVKTKLCLTTAKAQIQRKNSSFSHRMHASDAVVMVTDRNFVTVK